MGTCSIASWLLALVWCIVCTQAVLPTPRAITNEDIRDAILSIVHMLRSIEDKLERHEYRERIVSDHIKKNFITLNNKLKPLDPIRGVVGRLDERLANVETILMQQDEKMQKINEALGDVTVTVDKTRKEVLHTIETSRPEEAMTPKDLANIERIVADQLHNVSSIQGKLDNIEMDNKAYQQQINRSAEGLDRVKKQLQSSELLLEKYEHKLSEVNDKVLTDFVPLDYKEQKDWRENFAQALGRQWNKINDISTNFTGISNALNRFPNRTELELLKNDTLEALEVIKYETGRQTSRASVLLDVKFKDFFAEAEKKHEEVVKSVADLSQMVETATENFATSYDQLRNQTSIITKVADVVIQTSDSVMATNRKVDYGVKEILLEVGDLVKEHGEKINGTIHDRFDNFELAVLDSEIGILPNLTSKIVQEINKVWKQISIMHLQMGSSADTLNKLQNQTDVYVNGSLNVMDNMKGKVGQITNRMNEVDENLNHLMGRLSLVTQEFNRVKLGVSEELNKIRAKFAAMQGEMNGPGPHQIKNSHEENNVSNDIVN